MITTNKYQTVASPRNHNDWNFLPTLFCAVAGVGLGLMIGNYLGWL